MSLSLREVEEHARRLSAKDRARLAEILFESVREVPEPDIEAEWEREIEARVDAFERGETETFAAEDVLAEARRLAG